MRGAFGDWDYDSAFVYSEAETLDRTSNCVSLSLLHERLCLETADAYNYWTGGGADINNAIDTEINLASVTDPIYISVDRFGETRLALADFKVSNGELF